MDVLKKIFYQNSNKKFITFKRDRFYSFGEFYKQSLNVAKYFSIKNLHNKVVFIKNERSHNFFITLLGLIHLECIIFPISPKISNKDLLYLRRKYKPHLEINGSEKINRNVEKKLKINKKFLKNTKIIFFTSGTTGKPKGIVHNVENLLKSAKSFSLLSNLNKKDIVLHNWPHYYMAGIFNMFLCPLVSGSSIYLDDEIGINNYINYWANLKKNKISLAYLSPTMAHAIISYAKYERFESKNKFTKIFSTGSYLYNSTKSKFYKMFSKKLINCYGVTEVGGSISLNMNKNDDGGAIGKLSKGVKIKLSNKKEILIKSKYAFEGYMKDHLNIEKKSKKNYFETGDLAIKQKNKIIITGRSKEIIKKGGEAVSLIKIEDIALRCKELKDVVAKGIPSEFWGEDIQLDVVFKDSKKSSLEILKRHLVENLSRLEIPSKIEVVKKIKKTSIGKNYRQIFTK